MAKWMNEFKELTGKTHTEQGVWWLNGYWRDGAEAYAEDVWKYVHTMIELEAGKPKIYGSKVWEVVETCDLDELKSHHFLEKLGEVLTVVALRKKLKALDIDNNKRMALSEFLLGKFNKEPADLVNSPQGGQAEAAKLAAAKKAVDHATEALRIAVEDEEISTKASADAAKALSASEKAQKELEAAVADLEAQEKAVADKKAGFQRQIDDASVSAMKRMKAKNELAQVCSEDSMPLRKAKITQSAALKAATKAKKLAETEKTRADDAKDAARQAKADAETAFTEAEDALQELKRKGDGVAQGAVWWMERELAERRKYMPRK